MRGEERRGAEGEEMRAMRGEEMRCVAAGHATRRKEGKEATQRADSQARCQRREQRSVAGRLAA